MNTQPPIRIKENFAYIRRAMDSFAFTVKESAVCAFSWISQSLQRLLNKRATAPVLVAYESAEVLQFKKKRTRARKTYHYQPKQGITNAVITNASLHGYIVLLDVECILPNGRKISLFEVPANLFWHNRRKERFVFNDVTELKGKRIELHTGRRYYYDGIWRSNVTAVKVLGCLPPRS